MLSMYRDSEGQTVVDIKECETMREVKILKMGSLGLTDFDVQMFSQLTNLEEMDISDNQLDTIPECVQLPKLKRLDCSNNRFTDLQFVRQFLNLEEISTDGNQVAFADFCIASYLCPSLKRFNNQTVDIVALNRKIENRVKPMIFKVWNNHVKQMYEHTMNDSDFQTIEDKFRVLLKHVIAPMTKPISKFQDFRASLLIDEFLSKVRNGTYEEDIEFGGSADSVKKNYTKKKKEETTDLQVQNIEIAIAEEEEGEEQSATAAIVVAVADEDGNGVLTIDDVTTILTADQLKEASTVTIFVENVNVVTEKEPNSMDEEPKVHVLETDVEKDKEKDFIDVETERIKALDEAESVCISSSDRVSRVTSVENHKSDINLEERLKTKNRLPKSPPNALDLSGNGDERKVVRYWMYEGPKPKSLPSNPGTAMSTSRNLGKKENNPVNGTLRTSVVRSNRARPYTRYTDKVRADLISKFKTFPKMKVPTIDAQQAAMVVCEMHSAPMVVYRGRCKRTTSNSYATKILTKQTVKTEVAVADSEPTATETSKLPIVYQGNKNVKNQKDSDSSETIREAEETSSVEDNSKVFQEDEVKDVSSDSRPKCPPKKRVRFSDQGGDSSTL